MTLFAKINLFSLTSVMESKYCITSFFRTRGGNPIFNGLWVYISESGFPLGLCKIILTELIISSVWYRHLHLSNIVRKLTLAGAIDEDNEFMTERVAAFAARSPRFVTLYEKCAVSAIHSPTENAGHCFLVYRLHIYVVALFFLRSVWQTCHCLYVYLGIKYSGRFGSTAGK